MLAVSSTLTSLRKEEHGLREDEWHHRIRALGLSRVVLERDEETGEPTNVVKVGVPVEV